MRYDGYREEGIYVTAYPSQKGPTTQREKCKKTKISFLCVFQESARCQVEHDEKYIWSVC